MSDHLKTREIIVAMMENNPHATLREISEKAGVTRQRVSQIIKTLKLRPPKSGGSEFRLKPPKKWPLPRVQINGPTSKPTNTVMGTISELLVAADLMARGSGVFFPLVRTLKCDLIAMSKDGKTLRRVEVRSGRRMPSGSIWYSKRDTDEADIYAVVIVGEPVVYIPGPP